MVLTLSNGGVYFFQAGTEELVNEWVTTCNYWAARTSKEPLAGGVSNMEYGWNRVTNPYNHGRSFSDSDPPARESDSMSMRSTRSVRSKLGFKDGSATVRPSNSPWSDRIFINDWKAPLPPTVSSLHDEETQMEALRKHVSSMKKDLQRHNELREPMTALVRKVLRIILTFLTGFLFYSINPAPRALLRHRAIGRKNPSISSPRS
jgi:PH/SEC7 domain-containing protein